MDVIEIRKLLDDHRNAISHYCIDPDKDVTLDNIMDTLFREIKRLRKEKEREAKRNYLEIALNVKLIDERDILKKENEWLLCRILKDIPCTKKELIKMMQQALKEK